MAQTSDRISSIAARYASMSNPKFKRVIELASEEDLNEIAYDIRSMAASLLRQDEVRGFRKLVNKVLGR